MNINKNTILTIATTIIIIAGIFLFVYEVLPNYNSKQKDLGAIELMTDIFASGTIPTRYDYCPDVDWNVLEEELYKQIETTVQTNITDNSTKQEIRIMTRAKEGTIKRQIDEVLNPQKELCKEQDLYITFSENTINEIVESSKNEGYQQCVAEVRQAGLIQ